MTAGGIHHVGITVGNLDASVTFYCRYLACRVAGRAEITGTDIDAIVGLPNVRIQAVDLELPGGGILELLHYVSPGGKSLEQRNCDPGSTHFAIEVADIEAVREALAADGFTVGSRSILLGGTGTFWDGMTVLYVQDPDGRTVELVQPAIRSKNVDARHSMNMHELQGERS